MANHYHDLPPEAYAAARKTQKNRDAQNSGFGSSFAFVAVALIAVAATFYGVWSLAG